MRSHTIYLDVLRVLQQWCHHEISQKEVVGVEVEDVSSDLRDAIPVTWLHWLAGHHLQQRARGVEVVDRLTQVLVRLPLFQRARQLPTPDRPPHKYCLLQSPSPSSSSEIVTPLTPYVRYICTACTRGVIVWGTSIISLFTPIINFVSWGLCRIKMSSVYQSSLTEAVNVRINGRCSRPKGVFTFETARTQRLQLLRQFCAERQLCAL